jgi:hypothetical protein
MHQKYNEDMPVSFKPQNRQLPTPSSVFPYLDQDVSSGAGGNIFRLCRVTEAHILAMGQSRDETLMQIVQDCMQHRIFCVIEGAFAPQMMDFSRWLKGHKLARVRVTDQQRGAWAGNSNVPMDMALGKFQGGNFKCEESQAIEGDLAFLMRDPTMSRLLPWGSESLVAGTLCSPRSTKEYGPVVLGGDAGAPPNDSKRANRRRVTAEAAAQSRLGVRAMHLEGMGTLVTCGGIKSGAVRITAVEAADCLLSMRTAGFNMFSESHATHFVPNEPISTARGVSPNMRQNHSLHSRPWERPALKDQRAVIDAWRDISVRFGMFDIKAGSAYIIPAGIPHEIVNLAPSLSITWNVLPAVEQRQFTPWPWIIMQCALYDAKVDLNTVYDLHPDVKSDILRSLKHAPEVVMMRNAFPALVSVPNPPMHCQTCAKRHEERICSTQGMPSGYVNELRFRTAKITASAASGGAAVSVSKAKNAADITAAMDELGWSSHSHLHGTESSTTAVTAAAVTEAAAAAAAAAATLLSPSAEYLASVSSKQSTPCWECRRFPHACEKGKAPTEFALAPITSASMAAEASATAVQDERWKQWHVGQKIEIGYKDGIVYAAHIKKLTPKKITICYDNDKSEEHIKIELFLLRVVINGEWAEAPEKWAQCSQCSKWRKLPPGVNPASLPTVWTCSMNGAGMINECDDAEEFSGPDVDLPFKGPLAAVYEARRTICKAIAENSAGAYSYMEDIPALVNASAVGEKRFRPWKQGKFSLMANGRDVATTLPTLRDYIKGNADILRTLGENEAHKKALQTILTYTSKRGRKRKAGVVAKSSLGSAVGGAGSGGGQRGGRCAHAQKR